MPIATVALLGEGSFFKETLPEVLARSGFGVSLIAASPDGPPAMPADGFDLVIIQAELASMWGEERFFGFVKTLKSFIIAESSATASRSTINAAMSPEDILSAIGNVIHRTPDINGIQRRSSNRITVHIPVIYDTGATRRESSITTLSANGVFINTLAPLAAGTGMELAFRLPDHGVEIRASGRVLYSVEYDIGGGAIYNEADSSHKPVIAMPGMAVLIEDIGPDGRAALEEFVASGAI